MRDNKKEVCYVFKTYLFLLYVQNYLKHWHLCRDIQNYIDVLSTNPKIDSLDYFFKNRVENFDFVNSRTRKQIVTLLAKNLENCVLMIISSIESKISKSKIALLRLLYKYFFEIRQNKN